MSQFRGYDPNILKAHAAENPGWTERTAALHSKRGTIQTKGLDDYHKWMTRALLTEEDIDWEGLELSDSFISNLSDDDLDSLDYSKASEDFRRIVDRFMTRHGRKM